MSPLLSLLFLFFSASPSFAVLKKECIVPYGDGKTDDSPAILQTFQKCNENSVIIFSKGVKYNAWSPMYWKDLSTWYVVERASSYSNVLTYRQCGYRVGWEYTSS
jgi:hypothetical protein